jgi:hypothetical protein
MKLVARWGVVVVVSAAGFALTWWICEGVIGVDEGAALGIAGAVLAVLLAVAAWWAPRDATDVDRTVGDIAQGQKETPAATAATEVPRPAPSQVRQLLLSAVQVAATLTGEEKALAQAQIISAAVVAAPERVEQLIADAETAARSVRDSSERSKALGWVALGMAVADPARGEALARSIGRKSDRSAALRQVATAVAFDDPVRGEAIARSIEDTSQRPSALAGVAAAVAVADPERGEAIARSIEDTLARSGALAQVAVEVAVADPERARWLIANAETAARSVRDARRRSSALAGVAAAVAVTDPVRGEAIARSIENMLWIGNTSYGSLSRSAALLGVAAAVAVADPERGEAIARSIEDASYRAVALARVARLLAKQMN